MSNICCLIPAYNEEKTVELVIEGCRRHAMDIVVVDDGSTDGTHEISKRAGAHVIRHARNLGKGMALRTGFSHALHNRYDAVLSIDADGQHDAGEIPKFIEAFKGGGGDIIIGSRLWQKKEIPAIKYLPNKVGVYFISRAAGQSIPDTQSGFRLYKREVLERIALRGTGFEAETEMLIRASRRGFRISSLPVRAIYPSDYKSNFRPVRDFVRISISVLKTIMEVQG